MAATIIAVVVDHSTPAGACPYEMHEEQLGWEIVQKQWDALTEKEKDKYAVWVVHTMPCNRPHKSLSTHRYGYERQLLTLLEQLVRDMDRKIERAKERAEKEKGPRQLMPDDKIRLDALKKSLKGVGFVMVVAQQGYIYSSPSYTVTTVTFNITTITTITPNRHHHRGV